MREILCFHRPEEANGYLSNWYLSDFPADGRVFSSMEQYMMYQKTRVFQDGETAAEILAAATRGRSRPWAGACGTTTTRSGTDCGS